MSVLVDTSVWSLALRRTNPRDTAPEQKLVGLIRDGRVAMLGPIRQEILSGVRSLRQFDLLRDRLRPFADIELTTEDFEHAAECFNKCRSRGIQGSNTDFLICAASLRRDYPILTTDKDFGGYAKVLGIQLFE
jgi:predicted nucleic acid-binding protein